MPSQTAPVKLLVVDPVVVTETVADAAAVPVTLAEDGTVQLGVCDAPLGPPLTLQLRLTVPVNPFRGVMETVDVPLWPGDAMAMLPEEVSAKLGFAAITAPSSEVSAERALPFHDVFRMPYDSAAPNTLPLPVDSVPLIAQ